MATTIQYYKERKMRRLVSILLPILFLMSSISCDVKTARSPDQIFFITIDTLRVDHVGCYGYPFGTTPFIDDLAKDSVVFEHAYSPGNKTKPSHMSMFTGLYPLIHGVINNHVTFSASFPTMAEYFRKRGYTTVALSPVIMFRDPKDHRGFDDFIYTGARENGAKSLELAKQWLQENTSADEKVFMWLHLYDPHAQYIPPKQHYNTISNIEDAAKVRRSEWRYANHRLEKTDILETTSQAMNERKDVQKAGYHFDDGEDLLNAYSGEILHVDAMIEDFYSWAQERGLNRNALWLLTSDHGEALGNHGYIGHEEPVYNEIVHVMLLWHFTDGRYAPRRVPNYVRNVDIFPTMIALLRDEPGDVLPLSNGFSLLAALEGTVDSTWLQDKPVLSQFCRRHAEDYELYMYTYRGYSYRYISNAGDELYNNEQDYYMTSNIISEKPDVARAMKRRLLEMVDALKAAGKSGEAVTGEEALQQLRELGYLQ